ncbi:YbjN domain-containing protein [Spirochaeta cellobiosiphila]|uniref:YbjN domain-containing protein n=1 Tax=Spirochaeta cellobiosiphila TaxID=504483 RepID=UPI00041D8E66|nr:YbjN domain-containing protein [Spirochaeta cellobiosiphila]
MDYKNKVESYLINLDCTFENLDDSMWLITDEEKGLNNIILMLEEPILIVRINVMSLPTKKREDLYKQVLTLNGSDLMHGAYAIENENLILIDTLEIATLDLEELQASLDAFGLALAQHFKALSKYRD